jgi:hypothetical protein
MKNRANLGTVQHTDVKGDNDDMVVITNNSSKNSSLWPFSNLLLFIYYAVIPANPNEVILHLSQLNHQYCIKEANSHTT